MLGGVLRLQADATNPVRSDLQQFSPRIWGLCDVVASLILFLPLGRTTLLVLHDLDHQGLEEPTRSFQQLLVSARRALQTPVHRRSCSSCCWQGLAQFSSGMTVTWPSRGNHLDQHYPEVFAIIIAWEACGTGDDGFPIAFVIGSVAFLVGTLVFGPPPRSTSCSPDSRFVPNYPYLAVTLFTFMGSYSKIRASPTTLESLLRYAMGK
jgi:hypothetical protein